MPARGLAEGGGASGNPQAGLTKSRFHGVRFDYTKVLGRVLDVSKIISPIYTRDRYRYRALTLSITFDSRASCRGFFLTGVCCTSLDIGLFFH